MPRKRKGGTRFSFDRKHYGRMLKMTGVKRDRQESCVEAAQSSKRQRLAQEREQYQDNEIKVEELSNSSEDEIDVEATDESVRLQIVNDHNYYTHNGDFCHSYNRTVNTEPNETPCRSAIRSIVSGKDAFEPNPVKCEADTSMDESALDVIPVPRLEQVTELPEFVKKRSVYTQAQSLMHLCIFTPNPNKSEKATDTRGLVQTKTCSTHAHSLMYTPTLFIKTSNKATDTVGLPRWGFKPVTKFAYKTIEVDKATGKTRQDYPLYNSLGQWDADKPSSLYDEVVNLLGREVFDLDTCLYTIDRENNCVKFFSISKGSDVTVERAVVMTQDLEYKVFVRGEPVPEHNKLLDRLRECEDTHGLKMILFNIFKAYVCTGNTEEVLTELVNNEKQDHFDIGKLQCDRTIHNGKVTVKSKDCAVLDSGEQCYNCSKVRRALFKKIPKKYLVGTECDVVPEMVTIMPKRHENQQRNGEMYPTTLITLYGDIKHSFPCNVENMSDSEDQQENIFPKASFYKRMRQLRKQLSDEDRDHNYKGYVNPSKNRVCVDSKPQNTSYTLHLPNEGVLDSM